MQYLVIAGGDFVHQRQLQCGEGEQWLLLATVLFGDGRCCFGNGLTRAGVLKLHEFYERGRVLAVLQIGGGDTEALQLVDGEVDVSGPGVDACVGDATPKRDGVAQGAGEGRGLRVVEAVDVGDEFGGRAAGSVAIVREAGEVEIAHLGEIHLGAMQDGFERGAREATIFDDRGERVTDGVRRGVGEESRQFLTPPVEFRVGDAWVMDGGVDIGDFLAEGVSGVGGIALGGRQLEQRVIER